MRIISTRRCANCGTTGGVTLTSQYRQCKYCGRTTWFERAARTAAARTKRLCVVGVLTVVALLLSACSPSNSTPTVHIVEHWRVWWHH